VRPAHALRCHLNDGPYRSLVTKIRFARMLTEVFAPGVLVALLLIVVGFHAGSWWGVGAAVFTAGIPMAYVVRGVRRGRLTSHHIPEREHRRGPLLFGLASVLAGTAALVALGAPRALLALLGAGITGLVVFTAVTAYWKMSIHAGVAAGTVAVLVAVYGPFALFAVPLVPLIGWSRLVLKAHTLGQIVAGSLVGALIAGTVFPLLR